MAKQSGLGDNLYVAGFDLSGDVGSVDTISGPSAVLEVTGVDKSAPERIGGVRDGSIEYTAFFNPDPGRAHPVLSALPTADQVVTYCRGTALGSPAACLVGKQINYDPTRGQDGSLTAKVQAQANAFGLEWGQLLTAGKRTDGGATNGVSIDTTAALSFGAQAYLHVFTVTGTSVTVSVQDSADNVSFADVAGLVFSAVTPGGTPQTQRLATANNATIRRYLRVATVGTFSNAVLAVVVVKNPIAGQVF